jgi:hypothetical protein
VWGRATGVATMHTVDHLLNWTPKAGSHPFPVAGGVDSSATAGRLPRRASRGCHKGQRVITRT